MQAEIGNKKPLLGGSCGDSKILKWLTVEARVAIRMELQGQQEFGKFCWERDPGRKKQDGLHGKQQDTKMRWG